ncbi:response regulator [Poseidonocella sp. HB161398]|uniref:response regulator n=1 Tax=Poseidonocella sp. HB161398 TaxID=2320855 RepID=UPI0014865DD0|nr:response regulator [Poseidonocella sp. HB161398]
MAAAAGRDQNAADAVTMARAAGRLRIVLLAGDQLGRLRLGRLLGGSGTEPEVTSAATLEEFRMALATGRFDLALIDRDLGGQDGIGALPLLRGSELNGGIPAIMLSRDLAVSGAVEAMRAGCSDVLGKDGLTSARLHEAIRGALEPVAVAGARLGEALLREAAQQVVDQVAQNAAASVKPVLRRMYSRIATLRDRDRLRPAELSRGLDEIETECMRLWQFVDELGGFSASFARRFM